MYSQRLNSEKSGAFEINLWNGARLKMSNERLPEEQLGVCLGKVSSGRQLLIVWQYSPDLLGMLKDITFCHHGREEFT